MMEVITVMQVCVNGCPLTEALISQIARLTGVAEDVVRIANGLPVHHRESTPARRVILEVPTCDAGYGRAAFLDSLSRSEAPISASALRTPDDPEVDDWIHEVWGVFADAIVVYADLGISSAMQSSVDRARMSGREVDIRYLGVPWAAEPRRRRNPRTSRLSD
jgi:hypothetical protein